MIDNLIANNSWIILKILFYLGFKAKASLGQALLSSSETNYFQNT
jgi:hypothetical protein